MCLIQTLDVLGQRDPRWKAEILGNNTDKRYTIGGWGCLITSIGMMFGATPSAVNAAMKPGGFVAGSGTLATFDVKRFMPGAPALIRSTATYRSVPFPASEITAVLAHLKSGRPAVIEVDMLPFPRNRVFDQHFVLGVGVIGTPGNEQIVINDPWPIDPARGRYGEQLLLCPLYGNTLAAALTRVIYYAK